MSAKEISACRERPSCGAAVLDPRAHKRWHASAVICDDASTRRIFVGLSDAEDDEAREGLARGDSSEAPTSAEPTP